MAKRTVVWTDTAARQRREVLKYWVKRNGTTTYAEKLIKLISEQVTIIQKDPKLFKKADFQNTHVSVLGHFSIFYQYNSKQLIITAFWDNRQDPKKLLKLIGKSGN